jgi:predicted molibdopterin-dependent oxidoreductase YjgC
MCDIGRFQFGWVEGDTRLRRPMLRQRTMLEPVAWHDVEPKLRDAIQSAGAADPASVRFLVSAHAATEELFVLKQMVEGLIGSDGASLVSVTWNRREKPQPAEAKFKIHATDAPNVNGARDLGFTVGAGNDGAPDLGALRTAVEGGRVKALYVIDPGPEGSLGDVSWVVAARRSGKLPTLIVQGVVTTDLTTAADIVIPGAVWVEKDAIYTNEQGLVQASSKAINPPGEAREDWQILAAVASSLGLSMPYQSSDDVRKALAAAMPGSKYAEAHTIAFARPISASNWLQASNPSERWKWDFLYQDLPPVKGHNVQMEGGAASSSFIPLKPVE